MERRFLMAVNFDGTFKKTENKIPVPILDELNKGLNKDLQYIDENGIAVLYSKHMTIDNLTPIIDKKMEEYFTGINIKKIKLEDIKEYIYNTGNVVELDTSHAKINNTIPFTKKVIDPYNISEKTIKEKYYIYLANPFESFNINIGDDNFSEEYSFKRIPNNKRHVYIYKSSEERTLQFIITINIDKKTAKVNLCIFPENSKTVHNLITQLQLVKSYSSGTLKFGDRLLKPNNPSIAKIADISIRYWTMAEKIGNVLGKEFKPTNNLSKKDLIEISKLYISLVEKEPIRQTNHVISLNYPKNNAVIKEFNKYKGLKTNIICNIPYNVNLLGRRLNLILIEQIFNTSYKKIKQTKTKTEIILDNNKDTYSVYLIAIDQLDPTLPENKKILQKFKTAKTMDTWLNDHYQI
jgi:hypothetical protein